jgi:hypothetical protein
VPLQGVLFYIPHWCWKNWEGGKIKSISQGLRGATARGLEERRDNHDRLVRYINCALHTHGGYAYGYFFCEILNFVNVVSGILRTVSVIYNGVSPVYVLWKGKNFKCREEQGFD